MKYAKVFNVFRLLVHTHTHTHAHGDIAEIFLICVSFSVRDFFFCVHLISSQERSEIFATLRGPCVFDAKAVEVFCATLSTESNQLRNKNERKVFYFHFGCKRINAVNIKTTKICLR